MEYVGILDPQLVTWLPTRGAINGSNIRISLNGKCRWVDNVFVERLWSSLKYEKIYLRAYESIAQARASIGRYMVFFNSERRLQSLERKTPDTVYFGLATSGRQHSHTM